MEKLFLFAAILRTSHICHHILPVSYHMPNTFKRMTTYPKCAQSLNVACPHIRIRFPIYLIRGIIREITI